MSILLFVAGGVLLLFGVAAARGRVPDLLRALAS